ncbi:5-hydroxytryptamine receptor 4-like [Montipora foliosa]|uniref:5-hydroxytryptamine receptor 4-like n=1 Tax=Montipora foliosa TaxID=591990 RepID=UPI0035F1F374
MANFANETFLNSSTTIPTSQPPNDAVKWKQGLKVFLIIAEVTVVALGLLCNIAVVYAFLFYKKLRTNVTNYFVISMAISDILTTGLVTSFHLDATIKDHQWTQGEFMCSLYTTMYLLAVPSSIINLCAVTVDRYLVLKMPFRYKSLMTPGRAVFIICWLWIYAIIWACLPVMGWKIDLPAVEDGYCYFLSTKEYNIAVIVFNFFLPMIFMAISWSLIFAIVRQHHKRLQKIERSLSFNANESSNSRNGEAAQNVRGSRYIGFIVVLYYFCWFPYATVSVIANICEIISVPYLIPVQVFDGFLVLGFLNSALNPFLYPFHDKHFKEAFKDMWRKIKSKTLVKMSRLRQNPEMV